MIMTAATMGNRDNGKSGSKSGGRDDGSKGGGKDCGNRGKGMGARIYGDRIRKEMGTSTREGTETRLSI